MGSGTKFWGGTRRGGTARSLLATLAIFSGVIVSNHPARGQDAATPAVPDPTLGSVAAPGAAPTLESAMGAGHEAAPTADALFDPALQQVSCVSCGGAGQVGGPVFGSTCTSCGGAGCIPGRKPCYTPWMGDSCVGRFAANLYECLCCPDPCYQPKWVPLANSALFVDYARPRTISRFRWDHLWSMPQPDRAEFFWAKQNINPGQVRANPAGANIQGGPGKGPSVPPAFYATARNRNPALPARYPFFGVQSLNYDQLWFYQEIAWGTGSFFIESSYLSTDPTYGFPNLQFPTVNSGSAAGFGDMNIGTKSLLIDCELLQLTFQFRSIFPTGAPNRGLGTGHTTLEPSLLMSLKLAPTTYMQGQISEWIPLGGTPGYQGSMFHYHFSLNQMLAAPAPDTQLIGMLELNGWNFQAGAFTDPVLGPFQKASGGYIVSVGPSVRLSVCDKTDFGLGLALPISDERWYDAFLRAEVRVLY
jgi:hypothetical protein